MSSAWEQPGERVRVVLDRETVGNAADSWRGEGLGYDSGKPQAFVFWPSGELRETTCDDHASTRALANVARAVAIRAGLLDASALG